LLLPDDRRKARRPTKQKSPFMVHWLCPPWIGYWLASPLRRLVHKPEQVLAGLVAPGMTVADVGPGMGFFALPMARMVGPNGTVVCVDVQEAMLRSLQKRAAAQRLAERIITRVCSPTSLGVTDSAGKMDFVLVFAVVHEVPDVSSFFAEVAQALKPDAQRTTPHHLSRLRRARLRHHHPRSTFEMISSGRTRQTRLHPGL
jgi:2-polyprenyl-3-methyl-5-hydroxy-6-metoxy-1,4-benzoquinol methylase